MSIGALAALPVVGDIAKAVGDITKAITPLAQPFADVLAKALGDALQPQDKNIEFASAESTQKRELTY